MAKGTVSTIGTRIKAAVDAVVSGTKRLVGRKSTAKAKPPAKPAAGPVRLTAKKKRPSKAAGKQPGSGRKGKSRGRR